MGQEQKRLAAQGLGTEDWRRWGPYLSERSWGTVREDYSPTGKAWEYFDHDQARSRAYRWSEDGLGGICDGHTICACPFTTNEQGERLLALVDHTKISHILRRLLNSDEFLSDHGIRGLSRIHAEKHPLQTLPGVGDAFIEYEPGESQSALFGGNSNWRGPVWIPINYSILQALTKFHRYLGPNFMVAVPGMQDRKLNLREVANFIAERLINIFRRDDNGRVPGLPQRSPFQHDPEWRDLRLFHEYFHGETGLGLGASHQTGWTGLVANLIKRRYELKSDGEN